MNLTPIRFSVNTDGCDKKWDYELLASRYQDKTGTLQDFVHHIKQGHAVCAGQLGGQRRAKANVIGSQMQLLDVDNSAPLLGDDGKAVKGEDGKAVKIYDPQLTLDQALAHPFIQQYCALIYTSASHKPDWHKFRLVFLLPQYETDTDIIEAMIRQLMEQLPHDPACKDASRVFYGNTKAEIPLFNPNVTLPIEWREQAIAAAAEESSKKEQQRQARVVKQVGYQRQIERGEVNPEDIDKLILDALRSIPPRDPGTGNYEECLTVLMALYDHFGEGEAERVAEQWSPSIKGTTWDVGRKLRTFKRGGVGIGSLFHIAKQHGWKFPELERTEWQKSEPTISAEEWQYKFGLPNWFRSQLARLPKIFKGFGKPPKTFESKPLPKTIKYIPGELPSSEEYKALGCPTVRFAPGQRLQLLAELVELGYHDILDSSSTGTSKSHDAGLASPSRFGVDRLWYFSEDHRNPTTPTVEANYSDMPVRNNGMVVDDTRRTALNNPHIRWPRFDEKATTDGICWRTPLFHTLAAKGYKAEVGAEAKENPICGTCHMGNNCAEKGDAVRLPGASFRSDRRDLFSTNDPIRSSINSAPNPKDLLALVGISEDGDAEETETNRNGAFLDEAMRQLKLTDGSEVFLTDFDQTFGEIESKLPGVHEVLKPLRLALRLILAGEVAPTKETYHGLNDAAVRASLTPLKEKLFGTEDQTNNLIIPEIIAQLKSILPKLEEILKEPDGFNKDGVAAKDRKGISNETSKFIRSRVRQESYRDIAKELRSLPSNWLIPFLEVWSGSQRGALRINNGVLTVTTRNTRHAEICKAMRWVCYLDATATREYLALHLDVDPSNIVQIEQEVPPVNNLTIVQVTDLGLAGHGRSDSLKERVAALKPALQSRHHDIGFLEHKAHAVVDDGDGWWFNHNRGSNEYKSRSAIASIGTPYQNIGSLQDLWLTLTGDCNVDKDSPGFSEFVQWQTESEVIQAVGRLRANLRPDEQLTYYSCADFDLSFLEQYYPGATIKQEAAVNITPEAGTVGQRTRWGVVQAYRRGVETGKKITQDFLAKEAGVSQGRISQIASDLGGWRVLKKLLASLLESLYRTANNFGPLDDEQKFLANTYLPLVAEEDPPDVVEALLNTARAYGWKAFRAVLAATSPETRGKLLGALVSGLPLGLRDEFRVIASPPT